MTQRNVIYLVFIELIDRKLKQCMLSPPISWLRHSAKSLQIIVTKKGAKKKKT